jgi:hypothetical protein
MKRILLAAIIVAFAISANAQVQFGIKGGLNVTNRTDDYDDGSSYNYDDRVGFHIGFISDISLGFNMTLQPGILYSQKGCTIPEDESNYEQKYNLNYIDIPFNLMYKLDAGLAKIYFAAGPNFGFGIGGKYKVIGISDQQDYSGYDVSSDINFGSGNGDDFKTFDVGFNLGAGIQFSSIQLGLQYTFGISDLSNDEDYSIRNNGLGISLTYLFGGK